VAFCVSRHSSETIVSHYMIGRRVSGRQDDAAPLRPSGRARPAAPVRGRRPGPPAVRPGTRTGAKIERDELPPAPRIRRRRPAAPAHGPAGRPSGPRHRAPAFTAGPPS
jgi:hypothetical protein